MFGRKLIVKKGGMLNGPGIWLVGDFKVLSYQFTNYAL